MGKKLQFSTEKSSFNFENKIYGVQKHILFLSRSQFRLNQRGIIPELGVI
jgi:hypothetical protein